MVAYTPARNVYSAWLADWLNNGPERWSSARYHLSHQLRVIRQFDGNGEARRYRDWLIWVGCYPVRPIAVAIS